MKTSKIYALLLSLVMLISLAACGSSDDKETTTTKKSTTTTTEGTSAASAEKITATLQAFSVKIGDKTITNEDCAKLQAYSCKSSSTNASGEVLTCVYKGYKLADVLKQAGITSYDNGFIAQGSSSTVPYDKNFVTDTTLLAITKDDSAEGGPFFAPCASLLGSDYVKGLTAITIIAASTTTTTAS